MSDDQPKRIYYLGSFDGSVTQLTIPPPLLARANAEFDRERERREKEIALAKAQSLRDAKTRGRFRRAMTALGFRRGRKGR